MKRLVVMVMPESVTGYVQVFKYDEKNNRCIEERCGSSKDSVMVRDVEENFTAENWNNRVVAFKKKMQELTHDYPEYTFSAKEL